MNLIEQGRGSSFQLCGCNRLGGVTSMPFFWWLGAGRGWEAVELVVGVGTGVVLGMGENVGVY